MKISHEKIPLHGTSVTSKDYMTLVNRKRSMMIVEIPRSTGWKVGFKAAWYCMRRIVMPRRNSCWMPGEMSVDAPTWFAASRLPVCSPVTILKSCRATLVPTRAWLQTTQYFINSRKSVIGQIIYILYTIPLNA